MKYTDMCIYIDENVPKIAVPGENPDIENTIYNYLWLLVKALAIKKYMFNNFSDYDPYAFYAASRLFFALRKNYINQGKIIKGKEIRPIKSCLNYTKALLYPMKIEYQRETFNEVISEEFVSKQFDAFTLKKQLKEAAIADQGIHEQYLQMLQEIFSHSGLIVDRVLAASPFAPGSADYKKVKISIMINCLNSIRLKHRLDPDVTTIILWKLPKSMASYVRVLLKECYTAIKTEIMESYQGLKLDDDLLEKVIVNRDGGNTQHEN